MNFGAVNQQVLSVSARILDPKLLEYGLDYGTSHSAGLDLRMMAVGDISSDTQDTYTINANEQVLIKTGLSVHIGNPNFVGMIYVRSSIGIKKGLVLANGTGVIDADYQGELLVCLRNNTSLPVTLEFGERIAQLVVTPTVRLELNTVEVYSEVSERGEGGIGSTGTVQISNPTDFSKITINVDEIEGTDESIAKVKETLNLNIDHEGYTDVSILEQIGLSYNEEDVEEIELDGVVVRVISSEKKSGVAQQYPALTRAAEDNIRRRNEGKKEMEEVDSNDPEHFRVLVAKIEDKTVNGNFYSKEVLRDAIEKYVERKKGGEYRGELGNPDTSGCSGMVEVYSRVHEIHDPIVRYDNPELTEEGLYMDVTPLTEDARELLLDRIKRTGEIGFHHRGIVTLALEESVPTVETFNLITYDVARVEPTNEE